MALTYEELRLKITQDFPDNSIGLITPEKMRSVCDEIVNKQEEVDSSKVDEIPGKGLSTNDYTNADKTTLANLSDYDNYLTSFAKICTRYRKNLPVINNSVAEQYTHSSYIARVGDYIYVTYMYNDTSTVEGSGNQGIRMSKQHVIDPNDITYFEPAIQGVTQINEGTPATITVADFFNPILLYISDTQLRIFWRGTIFGETTQFYIDFNPSTNAFSQYASRVRVNKNGDFATPYIMTNSNMFSHVDWFFSTTNYLNTNQSFFMTSNIYKNGSYLWTIISVGNSGTGGLMTSVLARSSNNGATWALYTVLDCKGLSGTTGVDKKLLWEGAMGFDANNVYMILRGSGDGFPNSGTYKAVIPFTNLMTNTLTRIQIFAGAGIEKLESFLLASKWYFILSEGYQYSGPLNSIRTAHGIYVADTNFNLTRISGFADANGFHSIGSFVYKDSVYICGSTSLRRIPQARAGGDSYQNTSEIGWLEFKRQYFL